MTDVWLGIETTGRRGGVALVGPGDTVLYERFLSVEAFHSEKVLPAIAGMMDSGHASPDQLDGIAVSTGPGSYTGVRIGISTALGLSSGWGIPALGVGTLRVLSAAADAGRCVLVAVRARRGEVYAAVFESPGQFSGVLVQPGVFTVERLLRLIRPLGELTTLGSGRAMLEGSTGLVWMPEEHDQPRPSLVAALGMQLHEASPVPPPVRPSYLRRFGEKAEGSDEA